VLDVLVGGLPTLGAGGMHPAFAGMQIDKCQLVVASRTGTGLINGIMDQSPFDPRPDTS